MKKILSLITTLIGINPTLTIINSNNINNLKSFNQQTSIYNDGVNALSYCNYLIKNINNDFINQYDTSILKQQKGIYFEIKKWLYFNSKSQLSLDESKIDYSKLPPGTTLEHIRNLAKYIIGTGKTYELNKNYSRYLEYNETYFYPNIAGSLWYITFSGLQYFPLSGPNVNRVTHYDNMQASWAFYYIIEAVKSKRITIFDAITIGQNFLNHYFPSLIKNRINNNIAVGILSALLNYSQSYNFFTNAPYQYNTKYISTSCIMDENFSIASLSYNRFNYRESFTMPLNQGKDMTLYLNYKDLMTIYYNKENLKQYLIDNVDQNQYQLYDALYREIADNLDDIVINKSGPKGAKIEFTSSAGSSYYYDKSEEWDY